MIGYKNKTWCSYYKECSQGKECNRALTKKIKDEAEEWWGNRNAPIGIFAKKPDCFVAKMEEKK